MDWTFRTLVRGFLLVGGIVYVVWGALDGSMVTIGLGVLAAFLGAVGLWSEFGAG